MDHYDYLIIGNGVAGTTAAETIRERDAAASVAIVSDEPYPLYSRVLLPNYVKGLVRREQVFLRKVGDYAAKQITLLAGDTAIGLNTAGRTISLASGRALGFSKLLIASGGRPFPLGIPGEDLHGVSRFQTIDDADRMLELLIHTTQAVVAGGSFIALEYLEILVTRRIPAALVISQPYFFSRFFDAVGGEMLHENFRKHGIEVIAGERIAAIEGDGAVERVRLARGRAIEADFIGAGIGLGRNTAWLRHTGVELTADGIATDEFLEASPPGVFAAGDVADFNDVTLGFRHTHGNWGNAFRQGELAGRNMVHPEGKEPYVGVTSYGIRNLGLAIALVGHVSGGPGIRAVSRMDPTGASHARFFLREHRLVGAALINRHDDRPVITTLIRDGVPLSNVALAGLADPKFDIASLVP
ncbi:MAG: FAD-dependent oxidoreductase [bacterium]|nr:FAD-dependent oxidoreductase [bacterium]